VKLFHATRWLIVDRDPFFICFYATRRGSPSGSGKEFIFLHKLDSSATQKMSCHNFEIIMKYISHAFVINNWQISSGNLLPDYKP
jgi:hypothetical protein